MKKILILFLCLFLTACGKSEEEPKNSPSKTAKEKLIGKWKFEFEVPSGEPDIVIIEFMSKGNFIVEISGQYIHSDFNVEGTWKLLKDPLRLVSTNQYGSDTSEVEFITDDKMKLNMPDGIPGLEIMTFNRIN